MAKLPLNIVPNFKLTKTFNDFFQSEKSGGVVLIFVTLLSLFLSNSIWSESYIGFWETPIGHHTLGHWINDGLMTIFFLLIGLELEREMYNGELSNFKNAVLPIFGALGGMLVPAGLFLLLNFGKSTQSGAGIPMATDIAFAIGILSLLGSRVPASLKIFLTALAVIDDLGAIVVIAVFYTSHIDWISLFLALSIMGILFVLNRAKVHMMLPYLIGGVAMWYFMLHSGIHATITGVLLAFVIPFGDGEKETMSYKLQHILHKPVAYIILPLFALANTCLVIENNWHEGLLQDNSLGILLGLVVGKPLGILFFLYLGTKLGWCALPEDLKWKHIAGAGILGGIGFTMSIFITMLAFDAQDLSSINSSKMAILLASLVAGLVGFVWLKFSLQKSEE